MVDLEKVILLSQTNNKINIIGPPGSGKSTLGRKLSDILNYKLIRMDEVLYDKNCRLKKNRLEILENQILENNKCIIDGTYYSLFSKQRIDNTDHFIVCEVNCFISLFRIIKRQFLFTKTLYCGEKISYRLIKYLFSYHIYKKKIILESIPAHKLTIIKN